MFEATRQRAPRRDRASRPRGTRRRWVALLLALVAFLAVGGFPVETLAQSVAEGRRALARQATDGQSPISRTDVARADAGQRTVAVAGAAAAQGAAMPSFLASFGRADDGQTGQAYRYTVLVRNEGGLAGAVRVTTTLPPAFSNVRVAAPGFACSRQFTASGAEAGTLVTCTRNELAGGAVAEVTVDANAPSAPGSYRLTATAEARDDAGEEPHQAAVTVTVRG